MIAPGRLPRSKASESPMPSSSVKMKNPISAPPSPIRIVTKKPPGSLPGMSALPMKPARMPRMIAPIICYLLFDYESVAHRVLCKYTRLGELQQVAGAAGLRADARAAVAPERLAPHHRAGDVPVHVQVSHWTAPCHVLHRVRVAREQTAREGERQ